MQTRDQILRMAQSDARVLSMEVKSLRNKIQVVDEINRHICLTYDGAKDLYKVFIDGEKVESGSWAGDGPMQPVRYV